MYFYFIFMENIIKKNREIDLFDFTNFLGLKFLKFSGPLCAGSAKPKRSKFKHGIKSSVDEIKK